MPTSPSLRKPPWIEIVRRYQQPDVRAAARQLLDTFPLCLACFAAAWWMLRYHWLLSLPCSLLAGAMVIRVFIIQHDCGHGSFLPRKLWNDLIGMGCSLLTLTPYLAWRHDHAVHHATAGNLEHRGTGDIKTLTVAEFRSANRWRQLVYRLYRHPVVLFGIGPVVHFALLQRFTTKLPPAARRERRMERGMEEMRHSLKSATDAYTSLLLDLQWEPPGLVGMAVRDAMMVDGLSDEMARFILAAVKEEMTKSEKRRGEA